jgi:hypothetical protein
MQGTIPFMSSEILSKQHIFEHPLSPIVHQSVEHDIESFFWSFVWFALSRRKPQKLREDLSSGRSNDPAGFVNYFLNLFSKLPAPPTTKRLIFYSSQEFKLNVLGHLLEWSRPFEDILKNFRNILRTAFKTRNFEDIHRRLIDMLTEAAQNLPLEDNEDEFQELVLEYEHGPSTPPQPLSVMYENSQPVTSSFSESPGSVASAAALGYSTASPCNSPEAKRRRYGSFTNAGDQLE